MTTIAKKSRFYRYRQNNSGGFLLGPLVVFIEAFSAEEANALAPVKAGIYFEGGQDCSCCGSRWYEADEYEGESELDFSNLHHWEPFSCEVYYLDGRHEIIPMERNWF